jgi:hypothetical protein
LAQALKQGVDDVPHQEHARQSRSTDDVA